MRTLLTLTLCLLLLAAAPAASALSRSTLTLSLEAPQAPLTQDARQLTFSGMATFTGDVGAYQNTNGIPVTYTVTKQPGWASVVVSPATDVFPISPVPHGLAVVASRPFTVIVTLDPAFDQDAVGEVEITATHGKYTLNAPAEGRTAVPVIVVASKTDEACPMPLTDEQVAALSAEAAEAYRAHQASHRQQQEPEEVSVQNQSACQVAPSWLAIGAFGLVGAGVGLALKRRLTR